MMHPEVDRYRTWKRWTPGQFGTVLGESLNFRAELRRSGFATVDGVKILEIGFGNGSFMGWAIESGAEYVGTEIDPELVRRARHRGVQAFLANDSFDELAALAPFDLCVAWDVLEHIPRDGLARFLEQIRAQLTNQGVLVARVPSGDSPFATAIQNGDPTHYPAMGSGVVRYLAVQAGFSGVDIRPAVLPVWGRGVRHAIRRLSVLCCDRLCHPVIHLLMRNPAAVLTPNMVFTMRQGESRCR